MTTVFKIRSKNKPELFLKGTPYYHRYDKTGRIFSNLGKLRAFLTGVMNSSRFQESLNNWEIVELEIVIKEVKTVNDVIDPKKLIQILSR